MTIHKHKDIAFTDEYIGRSEPDIKIGSVAIRIFLVVVAALSFVGVCYHFGVGR
jgi:hypothetical protein